MKKFALVILFICALVLCLAACNAVVPSPTASSSSSSSYSTSTVPTCAHEYSEWSIITQPSCDHTGLQKRTCSLCGNEESEPLSLTDHTEVIDEAVESTCTKTGLTEGKHCSVCNATLAAQELARAKGHTDENGDRTCEVCQLPLPSEGISYKLSTDGTYYIVAGIGSCTDTDILIAAAYDGLPVKEIKDFAFQNNENIKSVSFEKTSQLEIIGNDAFSSCDGLENVTIPASVKWIYANTFYSCSALTNVIFEENSSLKSVGPSAFKLCTRLSSIAIPNGATTIGDNAFKWCMGLESITIPNSVTSIGDYAFGGCSTLTSIAIPNSVTSIGDRVFYSCANLTSITIPNSVTSIGSNAFEGCISLTSITIPNNVTSIGIWAFKGCSSLTSVTFENPNGWRINGTNLLAQDLADSAKAVEFLCRYEDYYWFRD